MTTTTRHRPVIITRPAGQAEPLARRVAATGREAIIFPLLEIHPLADTGHLRAVLNDLTQYAMVAFVSPNAIDAAFAILEGWPAEVAIAVVGEGSKAALARHGISAGDVRIFAPRDRERTDSQTLLEALDLESLQGKRVLILRGESGRELLADALKGAGVAVDQVAAYRRSAPELNESRRAQLRDLLDRSGTWLITSSEALRILRDWVAEVAGDNGVVKMQQQCLVVPHVRIEETARNMGFAHIMRTASGDDPLVAALQFQA